MEADKYIIKRLFKKGASIHLKVVYINLGLKFEDSFVNISRYLIYKNYKRLIMFIWIY